MALGTIQPLTEISTRNIPWGGKGGWCLGLTTLSPTCADCLEIWEPQPPGTLTVCPGLYRDCFTLLSLVILLHCMILLVLCCDNMYYNWINHLSNITIWWLDICCLLHRYQLHASVLMAIFRLID